MGAFGTRPVLTFAGTLMLYGASAFAQVSSATITAVSPEPSRLAPRQALYARVEYDSPVPFRLQAEGWLNGRAVQAAMMNPSPVYPAGQGEAIAWMALEAGGSLDEIHVTISDARWEAIADVSRPVSASPFMFLLVPAYPILQIVALVRLKGMPRTVAIVPLFLMVPVYAFCVYALLQESNLWPLFAIFTSMPSAIVVMVALALGRRSATATAS